MVNAGPGRSGALLPRRYLSGVQHRLDWSAGHPAPRTHKTRRAQNLGCVRVTPMVIEAISRNRRPIGPPREDYWPSAGSSP